jgi:hypothetical protein
MVAGWLTIDSLWFLRFTTSGFTFSAWAVGLNFLTLIVIVATAFITAVYARHGRAAPVDS